MRRVIAAIVIILGLAALGGIAYQAGVGQGAAQSLAAGGQGGTAPYPARARPPAAPRRRSRTGRPDLAH